MGILNNALTNLSGGFLGGKRGVKNPVQNANDFESGFVITEIVEGKPDEKTRIVLVGPFMPHQPFTFGGSQQLIKNYYAGSKEPTVQVLGAREKDTTIKGRLYSKRLDAEQGLREAARNYQILLDEMRMRGNLLKLSLGNEWVRYGFMEEVDFDLKTLADISYSIRFFIVGENPPTNCKLVDQGASNVKKPNEDVKNAIAAALAAVDAIPDEMPQSVAEQLNSLMSDVAEVIGTVTGFVDGVVDDATSLVASANRGLGIIRYARSYVSSTLRTIGQIAFTVTNLGSVLTDEAAKTVATIKSIDSIRVHRTALLSLQATLVALQAQIAALAKTVPLKRHLVRNGDNLQRLAVTYYNNSEHWKKIYDHNKLRTTDLTVGTVIEIPRL